MKNLIAFLIMTFIAFKLNAFDTIDSNQMSLNDFVGQVNDRIVAQQNSNEKYQLFREEEIKKDNSCLHCPKYLLLTEQINGVVENLSKVTKSSNDVELPIKINQLKFLYYTEVIKQNDGTLGCSRYLDFTPDFKPTKFDGQFKLVAEDILPFNKVTDIQYMNPDLQEVVYYYRGNANDKEVIVQAILNKDGGRFRYYYYTPSEKELNPNGLPDFGESTAPAHYAKKPSDTYELKPEAPALPATSSIVVTGKPVPAEEQSYEVKFKSEIEKRGILPRNIHFIEAKLHKEVITGVRLTGDSDTSIKGNTAHLALKKGTDDLALIDLDTKLDGRTEHKITIPYSVRMSDSLPTASGRVESSNSADIFTMSLTDKSIEYLRAEFRMNKETNRDSYVLSRDIALDKNETLSLQLGKGEDQNEYASLKHVKTLRNNAILALDVRLDSQKKATLYYEYSSKF